MPKLTKDQHTKAPVLESALREFATKIEFAQAMWRKYAELVEAATLKEPFLSAFRREYNEEPHYQYGIGGEEELIAAGILPKPKRIRFNRHAINEKIGRALANSGMEQVINGYLKNASIEELGLVTALIERDNEQDAIEILNELLVCDGEGAMPSTAERKGESNG